MQPESLEHSSHRRHLSRTDKSCDSKVLSGQFLAGTVQGSSCSPLFTWEQANPAATPKTMLLNWGNRLPSALQDDVFWLSGDGFWQLDYAFSRMCDLAYLRQDIIATSAQVHFVNDSTLLLFLLNNLKLFWNLGCTFYPLNATLAVLSGVVGMYFLTSSCAFDDDVQQ